MNIFKVLLTLLKLRRSEKPHVPPITTPEPEPPAIQEVHISVWQDGKFPEQLVGSLRLDDRDGTVLPGNVVDGRLHFYVPADLAVYTHGATLTTTANGDTFSQRIILAPDVDVSVPSAHVDLPRIVRRGAFLGLDNGQHWTAIECSDFNLLNRLANGEDVAPQIDQRKELGFNLLRVWIVYSIDRIGNSPARPELYAAIPKLARMCAKRGLYIEFTAFTGTGWFATDAEKLEHWEKVIAACQNETNVMLELVNEANNGANAGWGTPEMFRRPTTVFCSHGSNNIDFFPVEPLWDYATYRPGGEPRKVAHNAMEDVMNKTGCPTISNETFRMPDQDGNPDHAFDSAAGAALLTSGSCFHSVQGKTSEVFSGANLDCARAWAAGARSINLADQDAPYIHRSDLEDAHTVRVYQRGGTIVRIRA